MRWLARPQRGAENVARDGARHPYESLVFWGLIPTIERHATIFRLLGGIVVVGGIFALLNASTTLEQAIGFFAVLLGAGNAAGGYAVTDRMLAMFHPSGHKAKHVKHRAARA